MTKQTMKTTTTVTTLTHKDRTRPLTAAQGELLRTTAIEVAIRNRHAAYDLGSVLYDTYHATITPKNGPVPVPAWEHWGFASWGKYVETDLGINRTTAWKHLDTFRVFGVILEGRWDKTLLVSKTKMHLLSRFVTASNVNEWLRKAARMGTDELALEVERVIATKRGEKPRVLLAARTVNMTPSENRLLDRALRVAKGADDGRELRVGELLARIARTFLATQRPTAVTRAAKTG